MLGGRRFCLTIQLSDLRLRRVPRTAHASVRRKRISMSRVSAAHTYLTVRRHSADIEVDGSLGALLVRINQIPCCNCERPVAAASCQNIGRILRNPFLSKLMQQSKRRVTRLLNPAERDEAEAAAKRFATGTTFFKHVAERPERHHIHQAIALPNIIR